MLQLLLLLLLLLLIIVVMVMVMVVVVHQCKDTNVVQCGAVDKGERSVRRIRRSIRRDGKVLFCVPSKVAVDAAAVFLLFSVYHCLAIYSSSEWWLLFFAQWKKAQVLIFFLSDGDRWSDRHSVSERESKRMCAGVLCGGSAHSEKSQLVLKLPLLYNDTMNKALVLEILHTEWTMNGQ